MKRLWLWLRVRQLRQYLTIAALTGVLGSWIGSAVSPVPAQIFADVQGVPLVYLSPVVLAVSLAQWVPIGTYWFEDEARPALSAVVMTVGLALAFVPPLITSAATEVCLVSLRNGIVLGAAVLCVRNYTTAAAASATALVPCFIVWTLGWSESGQPKAWAFLLAKSTSAPILVVAVVLVVLGSAGLARLRRPTTPEL